MSWHQELIPFEHDFLNERGYAPAPSEAMNVSLAEDALLSNLTLQDCRSQYANETEALLTLHPGGFCKVSFDSIMCWPPTLINDTASIKCFSEFNNMKYDDTSK